MTSPVDTSSPTSITGLKNSRRGYKASVTRKRYELKTLLKEETVDSERIELYREELVVAWERYISSHKKLMSSLTEQTEIDDEDACFLEENEIHEDFLKNIDHIITIPQPALESPSETTVQRLTNLVSLQQRQTQNQMQAIERMMFQQSIAANSLMLPNPDVPLFSGDPMEYYYFIRAFESLIESRVTDSRTRLYYLNQYTKGEVNELVRRFMFSTSEDAYANAKDTLRKRYGQPYKIAAAYVNQITTGAQLKSEDRNGLRKYSVQLSICHNALQDVGFLSKIENPDCLRRVVGRLPYDLRKRWRTRADVINEMQEREITFKDISDFVEKEARVAQNHIFGDLNPFEKKDSRESHHGKRNFGLKTQTYSSNTQTNTRDGRPLRCFNCEGPHRIDECSHFKAMNYEEKVKMIKDKGLCFNCLIPRHTARECNSKQRCSVCRFKHHSLVHKGTDNSSYDATEVKAEIVGSTQITLNQGSKNGAVKSDGKVGLPIIPVKVKYHGEDRYETVNALLDTGSTATFCTESLMSEIGVTGSNAEIHLTTMGSAQMVPSRKLLKLKISDIDEDIHLDLKMVFSTSQIPASKADASTQEDITKWSHLNRVKIHEIKNRDVDLLIGNDNHRALEPIEVIPSKNSGPYAVRTLFGWVTNGPLGRVVGRKVKSFSIKGLSLTDQQSTNSLTEMFESFCNREFQNDGNNEEAMSQKGTQNYGRHSSSRRWSLRFIQDLFVKDFAELVPEDELNSTEIEWYLPHHPVYHPQKKKLRVVFDCSASFAGISLNNQLYSGPDQTNALIGVLLRFRQETFAIVGDVEAMFHQVKVVKEHRDALRFLWWADEDMVNTSVYRMKVHLFGATSSPSVCNFALRRTAIDNQDNFSKMATETVMKNFYVDDLLKSVELESIGSSLIKEVVNLLMLGGFRLTKIASNSRAIIEEILEEERAPAMKNLCLESLPVDRALGVQWNMNNDCLGFRTTPGGQTRTRRGVGALLRMRNSDLFPVYMFMNDDSVQQSSRANVTINLECSPV
ncbi:uncharacterized protein LOC141904301 [Tubulanus polymorphus]|uniref:uncharacterized protein LOC141904301 n=1 Tax=Tubulanus polymorphus TaxID=672921 RepID=UPI003DA63DF0